jgi:hypothetical protein
MQKPNHAAGSSGLPPPEVARDTPTLSQTSTYTMAAAWSVLGPLSEKSVANGSMPMKVPDLTRALWHKAQSTKHKAQSTKHAWCSNAANHYLPL